MGYGACGFADNLVLLQGMLVICERYGKEHNLVFSTDPIPKLSKTKCMYFCSRTNNVKYPAAVQLYGQDLPWAFLPIVGVSTVLVDYLLLGTPAHQLKASW